MNVIDTIADDYVERAVVLNPTGATMIGIPGHDAELPDFSPDGLAAVAALNRETLAALAAATPQDERQRVAKEAMTERLSLEVEKYEAGDQAADLNVIASPLQDVRQAFDLMSLEGEQALRDLATRMDAIAASYAGYRVSLLESAARGRVAARRQVLACAKQCADWTAETGGFYEGLVARTGAEGALRADLEKAAANARAATADFGRFLQTELLPLAREDDAAGRERYARASRYFLGAALDLDEAYQWGWGEVRRLKAEMKRVAGIIAPGGGVPEAVAVLDADPARIIDDSGRFRDWMQELADRTIAEMHGKHFDIPEPVRRIEAMIAPTHDGVMYYTPPSEDFSRPGRMWWSVPETVTEFSTWREVTTVYHEGVPGHHLQFAQAVAEPDLNRWQRLMCWVSGHGEGWALYAERLMEELGYLEDPGDLLGMLDAQMLRAVRVVIDLGVHLKLPIPADSDWHPGEIWNAELAWEFLSGNVRQPEENLRFELDRYLGWPGQAPSYKLGERIWLQARAEARARKGADFDLREFHGRALALGSLGLDPLRAALARI